MTRRPWLAIVVLVLIGINAAIFVHAARTNRIDDDLGALYGDDTVSLPCEVPPSQTTHVRVAILVDDPLLVQTLSTADSVIAIAPKTSPPRRDVWFS